MKVFGLAGYSGAGKTTLLVRLIPLLSARGLRVSTIKHGHHNFDIDRPGKDSYRHREAGASEVLIASGTRWVLMHELRDEPEPSVDDLIARVTPVDLLLIEGFKSHAHDKLEIHRTVLGKPPLWPDDPQIVAVAGDTAPAGLTLPWLDLEQPAAIADFILHRTGLGR